MNVYDHFMSALWDLYIAALGLEGFVKARDECYEENFNFYIQRFERMFDAATETMLRLSVAPYMPEDLRAMAADAHRLARSLATKLKERDPAASGLVEKIFELFEALKLKLYGDDQTIPQSS